MKIKIIFLLPDKEAVPTRVKFKIIFLKLHKKAVLTKEKIN